ncbi:MAG: insulinase family protein, partial [Pseudomonadota bacterium]
VEDEQLAISVDHFREGSLDPGLAYLYLTLPPGADVAAAEARTFELLAEVVENGVLPAEVDKARNIMLADYWREVATIDGKASLLGNYEVIHGDYEKLFDLPEALAAVTPDAIRSVAARVFRVENSTVGVFQPTAEAAE